jgi:hypothetical protein
MPAIQLRPDGVVFHLDIQNLPGAARLDIRCDASGTVWVSIANLTSRV